MKKFIFAFVGLVLVTQAQATSLVPSVLEHKQVPAFGPTNLPLRTLKVFANGSVVGKRIIGEGLEIVFSTQLDTDKLDRVIELAKDAENGEIKSVRPGIMCFVASAYEYEITANRGGTILYMGHPCNGPLTVNQSDAALELRRILDELALEAFGSAGIQ